MTINGVKAVISYDSDIDLFRGEFIGLNGGADFYASRNNWGQSKLKCLTQRSSGASLSLSPLNFALGSPIEHLRFVRHWRIIQQC